MNLVITQTRIVEVPVTTLSVAATCQQAMLIDAAGQCVGSTSDMPVFMPTLLEIDLATGAIKNWNVPTVAQLQAIADGQSAAVAPTKPVAERNGWIGCNPKQVEIEPFNPSAVVPDTVAVLEKYAPQMPSLVDESQMPYGYFDDERDPAKLGTDAPAGATHQDLETGNFYTSKNGETYYFSAGSWWPCVATLHDLDGASHIIRLPTDEPTDADTALCPDVPDSFYAAPAKVEPPQNAWTPDGRVFLRDLSAVDAHHNLDMPSFYMYQRFGLMTGSKGAIDLTPAGSGLLLMLRDAKKSVDADALVAHFGRSQTTESSQPEPVAAPVEAEPVAAELVAPTEPAQQLDHVRVWFDASAEKWLAETKQDAITHMATSTQGKFEAIKNVFKKAGLHGVYEINLAATKKAAYGEFYNYDGSRTLNADTVYMTQGADGAWSARMPNNRPVSAVIGIDGALTGLLKEMEGIQPEDAVIIETTDDEMRSRNKRRYAVTAKHEHAPVETSTAIPVDLPSVAPTPAPAEPVADLDDIKPVCTLKQKLEPLPAITDNGDLPSDFDGGDSDSAAVIEVTVYKRDNSGEYAATTGAGATYVRASSKYCANDALKNLLKKCKLTVADSAIVETTTDDDVAQNRTRYSIDTSFAELSDSDMANDEIAYSGDTELPEPVATSHDQIDIEQAIAEALERPEPVIDHDAPAPVSIVTELDLRPFHVLNQLISVQQRNCDPIYSAFFAARGITEGGKLSSKGTRLLAGLSQAESNERGEQIIKNACDVPETDATYDEIVALINHASTQMQALKLTDRISKHGNFAERQKLFFIQKDRIEALKADSAA